MLGRTQTSVLASFSFGSWPCVAAVVRWWCVVFVLQAKFGIAAERSPEVEAAIQRGVKYLAISNAITSDEAGLVVYACMSAGESPDRPHVKSQVNIILKKCASVYMPTKHHNYEAAVDAMGLVAADREKYKAQIQQIGEFLMREQKSHGAWDYETAVSQGDTSISQYAILGLWAASRAGVQVPTKVWDDAAQWHIKTQLRDGAFGYHPLGGDAAPKHSMTVNGVGSLAIIKRMLPKVPESEPVAAPTGTKSKTKKTDKTSAAATPTLYKPKFSLDNSIRSGMGWLSRSYTIEKPTGWGLYYLYGLERVGTLTNSDKINGHDWYQEGCAFLIKSQHRDGYFVDVGGNTSSTCFAILFMTRATEKFVNIEVKEDLVKSQATEAPLDRLLAELENPNSQNLATAQAAMMQAVQASQREQLIGKEELLLKLAKDSHVEIRRAAFLALGQCHDLQVGPVLIRGLLDPDVAVSEEARKGLCNLSRRPRGFGLLEDVLDKLSATASPTDRTAAAERWHREDAERWKDWYRRVRPHDEPDRLLE